MSVYIQTMQIEEATREEIAHQRIAELEAELVTHPAIADAAVIGTPDDEAGELPTAFIAVVQNQPVPTLDDVQTYLKDRLSHYKQIRLLHVIDAIPKSASGKILRRQLRDEFGS